MGMPRTRYFGCLVHLVGALALFAPEAVLGALLASVLPTSRSVAVGASATAFATMINTGPDSATGCSISPVTPVPAAFLYQTTDPATNTLTGEPNTPVDIAEGASQSFVIALTPSAPFAPTDIQLGFDCANTAPALSVTGLNTLLLSASSTPVPDIVALAATVSGDGILSIPGPAGAAAFSVATVNLGTTASISVRTDTGNATLPTATAICRTDPDTGLCVNPPQPTTGAVTTSIPASATATFGVFVSTTTDVPFDPAANRVFLRFSDSPGVIRGATSVAVRTLVLGVAGLYDINETIVSTNCPGFTPGDQSSFSATLAQDERHLTLTDEIGDALTGTLDGTAMTLEGTFSDSVPESDCVLTDRIELEAIFDPVTLGFSGTIVDSISSNGAELCEGFSNCSIEQTVSGTRPAWTTVATQGAPAARTGHTAVWTGREMIVWGGQDGNSVAKNTGGRFDPATNSWTPMTAAGAPSPRWGHTAIWTGGEMVVWGGFSGFPSFETLNDGGKYDPETDAWTPISTIGAPAARTDHTAVWTGADVIIWGGFPCIACSGVLGDGARYHVPTDAWTPISTLDAPTPRGHHSAVWTGSKMIVWGGEDDFDLTGTGGTYDPGQDRWTPTDMSGAPPPTRCHTALWTASRMIVFGGQTDRTLACGIFSINTANAYNPFLDTWEPLDNAPLSFPNSDAPAVWSGQELITWSDGGARYNPVSGVWRGISIEDAPSPRRRHSLVWTGSQMVVWGGDFAGPLDDGAIYEPRGDTAP